MTSKIALVVDDSKSARYALRKFLESHDYQVITAESAQESYELVKEKRANVIFLDHVMPGIDGFQALEHLRHEPHCAGTPIIICSSHEGTEFARKAHKAGAAGVLQKPPSATQLELILDRLATEAAAAAATAAAAAKPAAPAAPSKVSNIREPEVAIHQRVMSALRNTLAPPPSAPAHETAAAREAMESSVEQLRQELAEQVAELRLQAAQLEHRIQQQNKQQSYHALNSEITATQSRLGALEKLVEERFSELQAALDAGLRAQTEQIARIAEGARHAAVNEAHEEAERTVMSAATRISDQLAASIVNALRTPALKFLSPTKPAESSPQETTGLRKA
ncbi:MAG: response regulator [Stenotrophobium sp.]